MTLKKIFWLTLGGIGMALGALGSVLPMIPSVPFLVLATLCFAKSSQRVNEWFIGTKLYKNNLESYVQGQGMSRATKTRIIVMVTLMMGIGFVVMINKGLVVPSAIVVGVWLIHIAYFAFGVKTYQPETQECAPASIPDYSLS